jgi:hypothetical protein
MDLTGGITSRGQSNGGAMKRENEKHRPVHLQKTLRGTCFNVLKISTVRNKKKIQVMQTKWVSQTTKRHSIQSI